MNTTCLYLDVCARMPGSDRLALSATVRVAMTGWISVEQRSTLVSRGIIVLQSRTDEVGQASSAHNPSLPTMKSSGRNQS